MTALALLFALVFGLLCLLVWQVQKYFNLQRNLKTFGEDLQTKVSKLADNEENVKENLEAEKQLHAIINKRLLELEQQFPDSATGHDLAGLKTEMFTKDFKKMFHSTLNLLKVEHSYYTNR
ncbi:hypothetical protein INQ51_06555 [Maribellus sp. CM-23]|uniref:hypothetical protein n=1 Tax=Maribellus sp. CM-23 TaxID=2781026 RepID=UPI001F438944|nr:hypothetical protein [Maribellus sp. CM-23]MCE4563966.1 hypothetical protein [Maribellus sp. CM-23]